MRDFTEEELKTLADVLPNIALQLRTSMATLYTAVDRLVPPETREKDARTDRSAAVFYQSYYQMYRIISNLTDAGHLFDRRNSSFMTTISWAWCRQRLRRGRVSV